MNARPALHRSVLALGAVSFAMDLSSEIVHALLPLFMVGTLGLSVATVGLIDGIAEATASITKVFSGWISDRLGRRKPLILLGYGLAALSKPLFPLAGGAAAVLGARFADRIGKGIRGAPRDALIADVTPAPIRGRAFGLRQSMDTAGAFAGPLAAIGLMWLLANDIRGVFWFAVAPAVVAVLIVLVAVREPERQADAPAGVPVRLVDLKALDRAYWAVVGIGILFTLARFSEAFLILKASAEGLPLWLAPGVLVVMNLIYSAAAYPAGIASDRVGTRGLLLASLGVLVAADLLLALVPGLPAAFAAIALRGLHMGLSQGLLSRLVADRAPRALRGSAFGLFNLASGGALLVASVAAGLLWDRFGPAATFLAGAGFALAAAVAVAAVGRKQA
ncbi:MAG TPA: MFS transporter [Allosphingosinicella sp.]|nr:MFS transporter [Allosphingosinicella sp.]